MGDIICVKFAAGTQVNNENPKLFNRHAKRVPSIMGPPKSENNLLDKGIKPLYRWEEGKETKPPWPKLIIIFCRATITRTRRKVT